MKKNYTKPEITIKNVKIQAVVTKSGMGNCKTTYTTK